MNSGPGRLRRSLGASAIYFEGDDMCSKFTDGCLQVTLSPGGRPLTFADETNEKDLIQQLQNRLLCYRLDNFEAIRRSHFDAPQFAGAARGLARSLGACLINAPEIQDRLVSLLQAQDCESRIARSEEPEAIVLEALLLICHQRNKTAYVGEVAKATNSILFARSQINAIDGPGALSPREVEGKLTSLGIRTTRLDTAGRGLILDLPTQRRIHELARLRETLTSQKGLPNCSCCQEFLKT